MGHPLSGLVVLDLTHVLAGPFATMTLADLGARVIKVEPPVKGDETRGFPPFRDGRSASFAALNHSKASIALDLKSEDDRTIFERLLARADVLVENFRPGVMAKLGYGWESLRGAHPSLIYASVSGYGHTGPDARRPAYDAIIQARGGLMSLTGGPDGKPVRTGTAISDTVAALYLVQGILAALFDRARTGVGRFVDVALLDAQLAILDHAVAQATTAGIKQSPYGRRRPAVAPVGPVEAADGPFVLAAGNDRLFEKLCIALNLPLGGDDRFATNALRCQHARLLTRLIEAVTLDRPSAEWIARLTAAGIPAAPIRNMEAVLKDPQLAARNMIVDILDRGGRTVFKAAGNPVKLSGAEDRTTRAPAPDLDGNRGEILRWLDDVKPLASSG